MRRRSFNKRALALGIALAATLGATWWAASVGDEAEVAPAERARRAPDASTRGAGVAPSAPVAATSRLALERPPWPAAGAGLMRPPAPVVVDAAPPPPPPAAVQAPPLPFRFVGALEEGGNRFVVLMEGEELHILRRGERIDDRYRVERISPGRIEFTYLPLRARQLLDTSANEPNQ